jgi:hypothetical protein
MRSPESAGDTSVANSAPKETSKAPGGNLFALLEGASSKEQEGGNRAPESASAYEAPGDSEQAVPTEDDLETRREEIRQKFLEAIRAAADRRDQQSEE